MLDVRDQEQDQVEIRKYFVLTILFETSYILSPECMQTFRGDNRFSHRFNYESFHNPGA